MSYLDHVLVENRNGLIAAGMVTKADGTAERDAALLMLSQRQKHRSRRITVGAGKAYDSEDFVRTVREENVTPHVTRNDNGRKSNLDRRTTRHAGYAISLSRRWVVEKGFGWLKQTGPIRQVKLRRLPKVDWLFVLSCAAHNLPRLPRLMMQAMTTKGWSSSRCRSVLKMGARPDPTGGEMPRASRTCGLFMGQSTQPRTTLNGCDPGA